MSMSSRVRDRALFAIEDCDVTGLHAVLIGKAVNFAGDVACLGVFGSAT